MSDLIATQSKITTSDLSVSDEKIKTQVVDYVPESSNEPDRFEVGDYSGKKTLRGNLAIVDGEIFEIVDEEGQQEGFNYNSGVFKTE